MPRRLPNIRYLDISTTGQEWQSRCLFRPCCRGLRSSASVLVNSKLIYMSEEQRTRLTTWLIDQRMQGVEFPEISESVIEYVKNKPPLPVHERADRLLRYLVNSSGITGEFVTLGTLADTPDPYGHRGLSEGPTFWEAMAWSESFKASEVQFFLELSAGKGLDQRSMARTWNGPIQRDHRRVQPHCSRFR